MPLGIDFSIRLADAVALSGTNTVTSEILELGQTKTGSLAYKFDSTSALTGTLVLQQSVDSVNWVTVTLSPALRSPAGASTNWDIVDIPESGVPFWRFSYTNVSGTGTFTAKGYQKPAGS